MYMHQIQRRQLLITCVSVHKESVQLKHQKRRQLLNKYVLQGIIACATEYAEETCNIFGARQRVCVSDSGLQPEASRRECAPARIYHYGSEEFLCLSS